MNGSSKNGSKKYYLFEDLAKKILKWRNKTHVADLDIVKIRP